MARRELPGRCSATSGDLMFYVYGLVDSSTGQYFYIGKGTKDRLKRHVQKVKRGASTDNPHLDRKIAKLLRLGIDIIHEKIDDGLTENAAYELEEHVINEIGLSNLCNVWGGGFGGRVPSAEVREAIKEGCKRRSKPSVESRDKMSKSKLGTTQSEETKQKKSAALKGRPQSPKQREANARRGQKGRKFTEEHKEKLRMAKARAKQLKESQNVDE